MYERLLARRLARERRHALLLGPRQVGKSTLLAGLQPDVTVNRTQPSSSAYGFGGAIVGITPL